MLNPPFTLRELRCFVAAAERGRLSDAARELRIAQPALAHTIAKLERRLETELLERDAGGVTLTGAGRAFYAKARAAVGRTDEAISAVGPWARGERRIVLGFPTSAQALARPLRRAFAQDHPDVEVESTALDADERLAALRAGRIDVELAYPPPRAHDLVTARLLRSPRYALVPEHHRLAGRETLRFADVAGELGGAAGEPDGAHDRGRVLWCDPPVGSQATIGLEGVWAQVYSGKATAVLPRFMLSAAVGDGVRAIPLVDVVPLEVALVRRRGDERRSVAALLATVASPPPPLAGSSYRAPRP